MSRQRGMTPPTTATAMAGPASLRGENRQAGYATAPSPGRRKRLAAANEPLTTPSGSRKQRAESGLYHSGDSVDDVIEKIDYGATKQTGASYGLGGGVRPTHAARHPISPSTSFPIPQRQSSSTPSAGGMGVQRPFRLLPH